jgi:ribosomal protein S15P/S13E
MKYLLLFLFLSGSTASAQDLVVLLIGVSHNYSKYPVQDFSSIQDKISRFKPTAFFGEFLSREDERLVMDYWCKADNNKRLERLTKNRPISQELLSKRIDSLKKHLKTAPADFKAKTDLAHAYYLYQDVANGHYAYWQVYQYLKKKPDAKLQQYVDDLLSPKFDTTGRSMKRLLTSEYAVIAFPMMQKLGISELLAMDCQDYDLNWNASWAAFDAKFDLKRKDTTSSLGKQIKPYLKTINSGFETYQHIENTSDNVTGWLNSEEASAISASGDFYAPQMYHLKDFPTEEMNSKIHWWLMRNRGMCENVVKRAKSNGAKKVVVIAGANHRKYMQEIFEKMPGVKVRNINAFK